MFLSATILKKIGLNDGLNYIHYSEDLNYVYIKIQDIIKTSTIVDISIGEILNIRQTRKDLRMKKIKIADEIISNYLKEKYNSFVFTSNSKLPYELYQLLINELRKN